MSTARTRRLGVVGTMVWDIIHGRDARELPVEEWGGIAYALAACDAALPAGWELVPLVKVGRDLAPYARQWMRTLQRIAPDAAPIEVAQPNNRVELRYIDAERRSEVLRGGVPPWTWAGLAPLVGNLDAIYVNFISGFEMDLATAQLLRQHYRGPMYADLHSLLLDVDANGLRTPHRMLNVDSWCRCFDLLQVNEEELALMAEDGFALAATALAAGVKSLVVTLGSRGHVYFTAPGFERLADVHTTKVSATPAGAVRTGLLAADHVPPHHVLDPTGCGDVWGATYYSRLVVGDTVDEAMRHASRAAARNIQHRGATSLAPFLRGELSQP